MIINKDRDIKKRITIEYISGDGKTIENKVIRNKRMEGYLKVGVLDDNLLSEISNDFYNRYRMVQVKNLAIKNETDMLFEIKDDDLLVNMNIPSKILGRVIERGMRDINEYYKKNDYQAWREEWENEFYNMIRQILEGINEENRKKVVNEIGIRLVKYPFCFYRLIKRSEYILNLISLDDTTIKECVSVFNKEKQSMKQRLLKMPNASEVEKMVEGGADMGYIKSREEAEKENDIICGVFDEIILFLKDNKSEVETEKKNRVVSINMLDRYWELIKIGMEMNR